MEILPLHHKILKYLKKRNIEKKFLKQIVLLKTNLRHPSLNIELLEPKNHGVYSFRIDKKYRALFIFREDRQAVEILFITDHYR